MIDIKELLTYTKKLNILYVEDDKIFAKDTVEILDNFFYNIDLAINGEDGLEQYIKYFETNKKYYDIVITDIFMPKVNGLELTKNIYTYNQSQPIIVISAHNEAHYLLEFINIGIEYFIVKPFDIDEIMTVLYKSSKKIYDSNPIVDSNIISLVNNFTWNKETSSLYYKLNFIYLTKKEFLFIKIIIDNFNNISKIDNILNMIWEDSMGKANVGMLNPIISRLKKKLPEDLIQSIYGVGYKIISPSYKDAV